MTAIKCSIIIPHFNEVTHLHACLEAIRSLSFSKAYEVFVVDNGTRGEDFQKLVNEFRDFYFVEQLEKQNPYTSRNKGVALSRGEYIALLDAKCRPDLRWLEHLFAVSRSTNDLRAGRYLLTYPSPRLKDKVYGMIYLNTQRNVTKNYGVTCANLLVHKSVFQKIGPFLDDTISGNDIEWTRRALEQGYNIRYVPDAMVRYPCQSWDMLSQKIIKYAGGIKAYRKEIVKEEITIMDTIRFFLPMRWATFRQSVNHRALDYLKTPGLIKLWLLTWRMKIKFAWAFISNNS